MAKNTKGNVVLVVVVIGVLVLALAFFALNYTSILGTRKEAQTASDAAALFVATELTSVTIPSRVGVVGLVDLNPKDPANPFFRNNPQNEVPVIGYNTALATLRLDTLIANDLANDDMKYLAEQDRKAIIEVGKKLKDDILKRVAKGGPIWTKAIEIYEQNNRRLGGPDGLDRDKFIIAVGRLDEGQGITNCPIPVPSDGDAPAQSNNTGGFYKSCVDIPVQDKSFVFAPIGDEPRLVATTKFISVDDPKYAAGVFEGLPCAVIKIDASNAVREFTNNKKDAPKINLQTIACAQVGANRVKTRSTVYTIGFAGSFPSEDLIENLTVDSLLKFDKWGDPSKQQSSTWLKNNSGKDFPGGPGGGVPLTETEFVQGRPKIESPSTALAFGIYDWLRSLRLRPNRKAVVALIQGDDLRQNSEIKTFSFPQETQDEEDDNSDTQDADEAAEVGDEDSVEIQDLESASSTAQDDEKDFSPAQGCMVSLENGTDPRFTALRDGSQDGAQTYFQSFDYKLLDDDLCPETSLSFLVDPITGEPKTQAGNSVIELCQLVEGTVATNRAAFLAFLAGFETMPDLQAARRILFNEVNRNVNKAQGDLNQLNTAENAPDNPNKAANIANKKSDLAGSLQALQAGLRNYTQSKLVTNSNLSNVGSPSPKAKVTSFLSEQISPATAKGIANTYLTGTNNFDTLVLIERHRLQGIFRRARRMRVNGRIAQQKTVRLIRRLRRFSARGIRRIDAKLENGQPVTAKGKDGKAETYQIPTFEKTSITVTNPKNGKTVTRKGVKVSGHTDSGVPKQAFDLFPPSPAFVANIRRPGKSILGPGQGGGGAAARVIHIMPNNEPIVIRNNATARPHFFSVDKPDRSQEDRYVAIVEGLQTDGWNDKVVVPPDKELACGDDFFPQNTKIPEPFRRNWDTYCKPNKNGFGPNTVVGRGLTGPQFMRFYNKNNAVGFNITNKDPRVEPFFLTKKQLRDLIREAQLANGLNEEDGNPDDFAPGFEQVFILSCDGDVSFDKNMGGLLVTPVTKVNKSDPRYPFGSNMLLPDQYLYFNGAGLKDGPDAPGSKKSGPDPNGHPLFVQRSVIARDQFADLAKGKSFKLQPLQTWCKKEAPYGLEIGTGSGECPYPAGEFRIGIPMSIACCKLDPQKLVVTFKRNDFPTIVDLPDPFGDIPPLPDKTLKIDEPDEEYEVCPPIIRRGGKTGRVFGFLN